MLKLGIIGTNWITEQFIKAAHETGEYQLHSVYSRSLEKGLAFGETFNVTDIYDDMTMFLENPELDVVYIASPNSLHFAQSKSALLAGKHVIVEKPAVTTQKEWLELIEVAKENNCFLFEAARNIHEKSFAQVAKLLPGNEDILGGNLNFMKYSSRYDQVLAGEEPNIFSPKFAGGALMDLGIYVVYAAVAWFGKPESGQYFCRKIATGVDGIGTIILRYPNFDITMQTGKIANSDLTSEIYTKEKTIKLNGVNSISTVEIQELNHTTQEELVVTAEENPMVEEATDFAKVIQNPLDQENQANYQKWLAIGTIVHELMEEFRKQGNIKFPSDNF